MAQASDIENLLATLGRGYETIDQVSRKAICRYFTEFEVRPNVRDFHMFPKAASLAEGRSGKRIGDDGLVPVS